VKSREVSGGVIATAIVRQLFFMSFMVFMVELYGGTSLLVTELRFQVAGCTVEADSISGSTGS
jgi:hypothetical protein